MPAAPNVTANTSAPANAAGKGTARAAAVRSFGRLQLLRLLGKSERTTAWRVEDPRKRQELVLVLPRVPPASPQALQNWQQVMQRALRLDHPQLAAVVETGVHEGWPFVLYDPRDAATLAERLTSKGLPGDDAAACLGQVLQGLAYAHDAGTAHHDLQPYMVLVSEAGHARLIGLGVAAEIALRHDDDAALSPQTAGGLRVHRDAAQRDVVSAGLLLHQTLTGQRPLDELDFGRVIARLAPHGREGLRLPMSAAHPIAEPLRAIANRATHRQERQRYRNARTLLQALDGWRRTEAGGGGPLVLLSDRLRVGGVMPSSPGTEARASRLRAMTREHTSELAEVVLEDPALSFELLRQANVARTRGGRFGVGEPVLTVRRAIALLGMDGVRRAAGGLRAWPGTLGDAAGAGPVELLRLIERSRRAGKVARALRPAGYDAEVVYLVTLLQNLGRMVVQYHYPDEAQQIRRLMQPAPSPQAGEPEQPGMSEEGAACAVLGIDIETMGGAVARLWGLEENVLTMIRRQPLAAAVHAGHSDYEVLRTVAACANEAVDALALPQARVAAALQRVLQRYGRLLGVGPRDLHAALQAAPAGVADAAAAPGAAAA